MSYLGTKEWIMEVRFGNVPGYSVVNIQGEAPGLGTSFQPIWGNSGAISTALIDTAAKVKVASTSANDTSAGTGARTVLLVGLNSSGAVATESVTLNGQTEVETAATWSAINSFAVVTIGSTGHNEGDLWVGSGTFTSGIPATKNHYMTATHNLSKTASYVVPASKELYLYLFTMMVGDTSKASDFHVISYDGSLVRIVAPLALGEGGVDQIDITEVTVTILKVLGFFAAMLIASIFVIPRIVTPRLWKAKGSIEGIATASFFGAAALAGSIGLSPIVGAFAVGMALSTTKVFEKIENYISKIGLIFAPLFFAIIGAQVDFRAVNMEVLMLSAIVIVIAVVTKFFGCGLPAMLFLKDKAKGMRVGIGMISRGEVGLIVAGVGVSSGVLTGSVYSTIVIMVAVTTIITPIWLKIEYRKELTKQGDGNQERSNSKNNNGDDNDDDTPETNDIKMSS